MGGGTTGSGELMQHDGATVINMKFSSGYFTNSTWLSFSIGTLGAALLAYFLSTGFVAVLLLACSLTSGLMILKNSSDRKYLLRSVSVVLGGVDWQRVRDDA